MIFFPTQKINIINALLQSIILIIVFNDLLKFVFENDAISIFFLFLLTYVFSNVLKNIVVYTDLVNGIVLFYITTFFQIFFGIMFSFVNVKTKVFSLSKERIADKHLLS
jgi:hypothetical protein